MQRGNTKVVLARSGPFQSSKSCRPGDMPISHSCRLLLISWPMPAVPVVLGVVLMVRVRTLHRRRRGVMESFQNVHRGFLRRNVDLVEQGNRDAEVGWRE